MRFGADRFVAFFAVFADFFAVAFTALFFLRAGAAFFFAAVRFFVFAFFAMIVLPIQAANMEPVAPHGGTGIAPRAERAPCSPRCRGRAHRRHRPMLPKRRRTWSPGGPVDQFDRVDGRDVRARSDLCETAKIACCDHIRS